MPSNYLTPDPIQGQIDLDDKFITDAWLVDQFVGGTAFGFGQNGNAGVNPGGVLGLGDNNNRSSPVQIGNLVNWKQVSVSLGSGSWTTIALKNDGTLWGWGRNSQGQLGNGTTTGYSSPIQIGSLTNWKQVSNGRSHVAAVKTDGTLWTWGNDAYGQLGNGTTTGYSSPIQIGSLTNWKYVACGGQHTMAIKTDGTLWGWGVNDAGQLGNGTTSKYSSPIQIGSLTNWKQLACAYNTLSVKTDGTLWAWGYNSDGGQLGNGTVNINYSSPVQVGALTNWKQVAANFRHCLAVKTDGTMWGWGIAYYGQLGFATGGGTYSSPVQVGALTNWKQAACGYQYTVAIKTDGTMWGCGYNNYGQLGNGNTINYSSPIQVGLLTNWKQVSCGHYSTLAITYKDLG